MSAYIPLVPLRSASRGRMLPAVIAMAGLVCASFMGSSAFAAPPAAAASAAKARKATPAPAPKGKPVARANKGKAKPVPPPTVDVALPPAPQEQLDAAERVYYGVYDCEFKQVIEIQADPKNVGYVEVKHAKSTYLMKPVLSSTGAVRLEDVRGVTLMVQIAQKSMLMDVKVGHRLVDECVSPRQRELMDIAKAKAIEDAKAAAAASAAEKADVASPDAAASGAATGDSARAPSSTIKR